MALKLSIFTTVTDPGIRGDNYKDALKCYEELADQIIVVDGAEELNVNYLYTNYKVIFRKWRKEFKWDFIGQQFQRGYEACSGDWVIHADLDFIFHEKDFESIRQACLQNNDAPALSFWKYQFILPDRYNLKSRLVIAVNKGKYGDRIRFNSGGDLCQPSLDGKEIKPDSEARVPFYNYEKLIKTKEQIMDDVGRMDRAYAKHFGHWLYSKDGSNESAYEGWLNMAIGRYHKPSRKIKLYEHPKYIQETIKNLTPDQFGYNAFGLLEKNNYAS